MFLTLLTVLFLAAMWAAVLAPPLLQNRKQAGRGGDSIRTFRHQLDTLGRTGTGGSAFTLNRSRRNLAVLAPPLGQLRAVPDARVVAPTMRPGPSGAQVAAQRRRRSFLVLASVAVITLAAAFAFGGRFVWAHLLADLLLAVYVALVFHVMRTQAEREMKVAFLPHADDVAEPVVLLREVGAR